MPEARAGLVILAVLMVVTMSALVALSIVSLGGATRVHADASDRRQASEAIAWSGVQIVIDELAEQRNQMIAGEVPTLTQRTELFTTAAGEFAVVQLVADESDDTFSQSATVLHPTAACLNMNSADESMLGALEGLGTSGAASIISERARGPFASVAEAAARCDVDLVAVAESLCVGSCEPEIQSGVAGPEYAGEPRINILKQQEALLSVLDDTLSIEAADAVRQALEAGAIDSRSSLIAACVEHGVPQDSWATLLDVVCFEDDAIAIGRVDLLSAPEVVLAAVPGISADAARTIVSTRSRLGEETRRTLTWPVEFAALSQEAFQEAIPWLTNRSLQVRVRVRAGFALAGDDDTLSAAELRDNARTDRLSSRVEWEVVIDASESPPRVASIRDVTSESAWAQVEAHTAPPETDPNTLAETAGARPRATQGAAAEPPTSDESQESRDVTPRIGRWFSVGGAG